VLCSFIIQALLFVRAPHHDRNEAANFNQSDAGALDRGEAAMRQAARSCKPYNSRSHFSYISEEAAKRGGA